jgi:5-hydroxyisourate hydrolase-like protein (transthyretin family)
MPTRALVVAVAVAATLAVPQIATAGTYTVASCDAAPPTHNVNAWWIQGGSVNSYALCPSLQGGGLNTRGMSTRATGRTFGGGEFSRWWFSAPGGTHITRLDWSGRGARDTPSWAIELSAQGGVSNTRLVGYPAQPGAASYTSGFEWPNPVPLWTPAGTTSLTQNTQCGAGSCGSGATMHTYSAVVTLNDFSSPNLSASGIADNEWVRTDRAISYSASDNIGIKWIKLLIDGAERGTHGFDCDYSRPAPCSNRSGAFNIPTTQLSPGPHRIDLVAVDGSDTPVYAGLNIRVDNTPPAQVTPTVTGGDDWRKSNGFTVDWPSVADGGSPIVGGTWQLCRPGRVACVSQPINQTNPTATPAIDLPADGAYELRAVVRDQAGNVANIVDARPAQLRLDRAAPSLAIDTHDPNEPVRASATVNDPLSGLAGGQLEIRRVGTTTWRELATTVEGERLIAQIDDERFADGSYELRAQANDRAGNHISTGLEANQARALRQFPVRIKTQLRAGRQQVKTVRRKVGRGKAKRIVKRRVVRFRSRFPVALGRHAEIQGVLTNPDGQPLHDVPIQVLARPDLPGAGFAATGIVRTDRDGRFTYKVRGTTSRTIQFRYGGAARIRPSTTEVKVAVPASSTFVLTPPRILNGETVTFKGRVRGGPIPSNGKLIELRKWTGRQWAPFRLVRTDAAGRWQHTEPVVSVSGLVIFKLRANIPAEAGFPFAAGRTVARKLRVQGL